MLSASSILLCDIGLVICMINNDRCYKSSMRMAICSSCSSHSTRNMEKMCTSLSMETLTWCVSEEIGDMCTRDDFGMPGLICPRCGGRTVSLSASRWQTEIVLI